MRTLSPESTGGWILPGRSLRLAGIVADPARPASSVSLDAP
jgi:hypothetical protein